MRVAVIYRPKFAPPPERIPELMQGLSGWLSENQGRFTTMEFFVGGGGFGVGDVADSADLQRMVASHPFTPFSDVEIRPVVEPAQAMQILGEVFAAAQ
jgi:hypothetical protein